MCFELVNFGSSMRPKIFGSLFVDSVVLLICGASVVLYSASSGVLYKGVL